MSLHKSKLVYIIVDRKTRIRWVDGYTYLYVTSCSYVMFGSFHHFLTRLLHFTFHVACCHQTISQLVLLALLLLHPYPWGGLGTSCVFDVFGLVSCFYV